MKNDDNPTKSWRTLFPILVLFCIGFGLLFMSNNTKAMPDMNEKQTNSISFRDAVDFCKSYSAAGYKIQFHRLQGMSREEWKEELSKIPDGVKLKGGSRDDWLFILDFVFDSYDGLLTAIVVRDTMFSNCMNDAMSGKVPDRMNPIYPSAIKGEA